MFGEGGACRDIIPASIRAAAAACREMRRRLSTVRGRPSLDSGDHTILNGPEMGRRLVWSVVRRRLAPGDDSCSGCVAAAVGCGEKYGKQCGSVSAVRVVNYLHSVTPSLNPCHARSLSFFFSFFSFFGSLMQVREQKWTSGTLSSLVRAGACGEGGGLDMPTGLVRLVIRKRRTIKELKASMAFHDNWFLADLEALTIQSESSR